VRRGALAAAAVLAAASACATRAAALPEPPARRPVEFTPVPPMEAVHVSNPHDHKGKPLCERCHVRGEPGVKGDPIALCAQCHQPSVMKHPYGIASSRPPADLPLADGRIVCSTCHDPHDVKKHRKGLRLDYLPLCAQCHTGHGAKAPPAGAQ